MDPRRGRLRHKEDDQQLRLRCVAEEHHARPSFVHARTFGDYVTIALRLPVWEGMRTNRARNSSQAVARWSASTIGIEHPADIRIDGVRDGGDDTTQCHAFTDHYLAQQLEPEFVALAPQKALLGRSRGLRLEKQRTSACAPFSCGRSNGLASSSFNPDSVD